ncbi:conjugative transposon protein TraN [Elizabethkingia anophelis]|nr:conjugative transposon protein TraN [Elizabethkingia anophelis]
MVYATEVSFEEYMTYTTEETEKLEVMQSGMYIERGMYGLKKEMRDGFREFLEVIFQAAALVIDTIRTFFLIVLSILGPIAFAISVWDGFQSTLNVLRIKAAVQNFEPETNFSVITEDGKFYSFDVFYSSAPAVLTYDLLKMKQVEKQKKSEFMFGELEGYSPSVADLIMESIYHRGKKIVRNIYSDNYGIAFSLKGIYVHQGKLYFHTALNNTSNLPFIIDAVTFSIVDKKKAKKTIFQDQTLTPLRIYKVPDKVMESSEESNVFMLEQFTLTKDKILLIEIYEKNGDRNQLIEIKSSAIIKAKTIDFD